MRSYLLSILAAALFSSAVLLLLPERPELKRGVKLLSSLLILLLILSPLSGTTEILHNFFTGDFFSEDPTLSYEETRDATLESASAAYLEDLIKEDLMKTFSIREGDLAVRVICQDGVPSRVLLLLSGRAVWQDSAKLESRVTERLGLPTSSAIA